jgi:hypothetical protein
MQKRQKFNGLERVFDGGHGVDENGLGRIGPGRGFIERRNTQDFHPQLFQPVERASERRRRRTGRAWQVGA